MKQMNSDILLNETIQLTEFDDSSTDYYGYSYPKGYTALHVAVWNFNYDLLISLLSKNIIDIDAQDQNGFTALHYACFYEETKIIKLLLNNNACIDLKTINGDSISNLSIPKIKQILEFYFIQKAIKDLWEIDT